MNDIRSGIIDDKFATGLSFEQILCIKKGLGYAGQHSKHNVRYIPTKCYKCETMIDESQFIIKNIKINDDTGLETEYDMICPHCNIINYHFDHGYIIPQFVV